MRCLKLLFMTGIVLVFSTQAVALPFPVPLPPNGTMTVDAFGAFSEVFLEVTADVDIGGGMVLGPGLYNNVAIGYTEDNNGPAAGGVPDFVLYTGAWSFTGAAPVAPGTIVAVGQNTIVDAFQGTGPFADKTRGRLYVGGVVQSITTTESVSYNKGGLAGSMDPNPNPQIAFSVYNAYVDGLTLATGTPGIFGGVIQTDWVLTADQGEEVHLDIWADAVPDATLAAPTTGMPPGMRYVGVAAAGTAVPELPVRDLSGALLVNINDGTYYDRFGTGWEEIAYAGDPADGDIVFWSFQGNPESLLTVREIFNVAPAEFFVDPATGIVVYTSGPSSTVDPTVGPGFSIIGQFIPGPSLAPLAKTDPLNPGFGYGNNLLADEYLLTADFRFGGSITGAYDSDPNTFTFQQGEPGSIATLTQLQGTLIPEPVTVTGMLIGLCGLVRYVHRRRLA